MYLWKLMITAYTFLLNLSYSSSQSKHFFCFSGKLYRQFLHQLIRLGSWWFVPPCLRFSIFNNPSCIPNCRLRILHDSSVSQICGPFYSSHTSQFPVPEISHSKTFYTQICDSWVFDIAKFDMNQNSIHSLLHAAWYWISGFFWFNTSAHWTTPLTSLDGKLSLS